MRIAYLITELNSGGAEWQLARLARDLKEEGHEICVACLYDGDGEVGRWLKSHGIDVVCAEFRRSYQVHRLYRLVRVFREFQPHLLHTWMFHANMVGKLLGPPLFIHPIIASLRVAERERSYHVMLERLTSWLNAAVVCNSEELAEFAASHGIPRQKLHVIPNSFDEQIFRYRPPSPPAAGETFRILLLGRITRQKGQRDLLTALDILRQRHQLSPHVTMAGQPEPSYLQEVREDIRRYKLDEWVSIIPPCPHEQVPELIQNHHLLVLPSLWEGMPNAVMEAMACGVPVVATRTEGISRLIVPRQTGCVVPTGDAQALADEIAWAMTHYEAMQDMANAARQKLESEFGQEQITRRYFQLYCTIRQRDRGQ